MEIFRYPTKHKLTNKPWPEYDYQPDVNFEIYYTDTAIRLKFTVIEETIRAVNNTPNSPVWQDSCVEMFISFGKGYYNFEMNPIGAILAAYGPDRDHREFLPVEKIRGITTFSTIAYGNPVQWSIDLTIPVSTFIHNESLILKGAKAKANFFKCGDLLPKPHFLSWAPINAPTPDFHLPQFFDDVIFS
ncbi:MAG: hypothetical protein EOO02_05265 [Chitinophagaceae bacterium]|nr:MAG: hypothetical protein EOO02_05265 [Chitinophagaceae bacterium]